MCDSWLTFEARFAAQIALDSSYIENGYSWNEYVIDRYCAKFDVSQADIYRGKHELDFVTGELFSMLDEHADLYGHPYLDHRGMKLPEYRVCLIAFCHSVVTGSITSNPDFIVRIGHWEKMLERRAKKREFLDTVLPWRAGFWKRR